jgi:hypothetical protein
MIFGAEDVGQQDGLVAFAGDEADGDARDGVLDGHAGIHEGEGAHADGRHRGGAVGAHDLGDDAHGVGVVLGHHRLDGTLGEGAVADFAAVEAAEAA